MAESDAHINAMEARMRHFEVQLGKMQKALAERSPGTVLSTIENNPRKRVQAITLGSGRKLEEVKGPREEEVEIQPNNVRPNKPQVEEVAQEEKEVQYSSPRKEDKGKGKEINSTPIYSGNLPFPCRLKNPRDEGQFSKFSKILKQLHVNIPFVDTFAQMPKYAKYLKDLITNKRKI